MKIGYVRVSKKEQNEHLQTDALTRFGWDRVLVEKIAGASTKRPQYEKVLEMLRRDDELVVWDIDRLGRATLELIMLIARLNGMGIRFRSLTQPLIDTTTPHRFDR